MPWGILVLCFVEVQGRDLQTPIDHELVRREEPDARVPWTMPVEEHDVLMDRGTLRWVAAVDGGGLEHLDERSLSKDGLPPRREVFARHHNRLGSMEALRRGDVVVAGIDTEVGALLV